MRLRLALVLAIASCAPPREPLRELTPPPAPASAAPSPAPAEALPPPPARVSRAGTCGLDRAVADYVLGQDAARCGELGPRASKASSHQIT